MIANLPPYPEYKESGLPWVGTMPAHWSQRRMKFLFRERVQKGFPDEPLLAATQTKGVVRKADYGERTVTVTKDFHFLKLVEPGDYVISLRSFEGGIEVAHCRGIISPAYTVLAPRPDSEGGYFTRFFKSPDFIRSLTLFVTGIREGQNIDYERLSRAYMPLPPPEEQAAIVRFLDYANGRLERAIRAKRKVIALLHEQKQAIIHRAVTRGLYPTVPLKPSGIPWLGDIPKHWGITKVRRVVESHKQGFYTKEGYVESGTPLLRITDLRDDSCIDFASCPKLRVSEGVKRQFGLQIDDFVFVRSGATIGKFGIVRQDTDAIFGSYTIRFRFQRLMWREFLKWYFKSRGFTDGLLADLHGGAIVNVNAENIKNQFIPVPPEHEQKEIDLFLARELRGFDEATRKEDREIELLREYRTRLVADVVTGKLDVRPAARHLPVEPEKFEDLVENGELLDETELEKTEA